MKNVTVLDKTKTKSKPKVRKTAKNTATTVSRNSLSAETSPPLELETEEQSKKREAALKRKTLKAFQMFYDTYHAGKSNWDF